MGLNNPAQLTKLHTFANAFVTPTTLTSSYTSRLERRTIELPVTTFQWRLHVQNWIPNTDALGTANVSFAGVYMGTPDINNFGAPTGAFTATPTEVLQPFALTGGTPYVSPWVTSPAMQFNKSVLQMLSWAWELSSGSVATGSGARDFMINNNTATTFPQVGVISPTGLGSDNTGYFDIWIEYQFVESIYYKKALALGDSRSQGYVTNQIGSGPTLTPNIYTFNHQVWHQRAGNNLNLPFLTCSASGYTTSNFLSALNGMYTRFGLGTLIIPDYAIIDIGINDVRANQSYSTVWANIIAIGVVLKGLGIKSIWVATQTPAYFSGLTAYFQHGLLTTAASTGATSIITDSPICVDALQTLNIGIGSQVGASDWENVTCSGVSTGTGPYTTALSTPTTLAHAVGVEVATVGEFYRTYINQQIITGFSGMEGCFDFDELLANPAAPWGQTTKFSGDYLHYNQAGHARIAAHINLYQQ